MEAVALFDFQATAEDELSFRKGTVLKILDSSKDPNWFQAERDGQSGLVPANFIEVKPHPWFLNKIKRDEAEEMLMKKSEGEYIVRESESSQGDFSLSVRFSKGVQHFKILQDGQGKYFLWIQKFLSINQLLDYHKTNSVSRNESVFLKDSVQCQIAQGMYTYTTDDPEELSFAKGDKLEILDSTDSGWWMAKHQKNQKKGLIPATYVELCS